MYKVNDTSEHTAADKSARRRGAGLKKSARRGVGRRRFAAAADSGQTPGG